MFVINKPYKDKFLSLLLIISFAFSNCCSISFAAAETNDLNFKVYNPEQTDANAAADTSQSPASPNSSDPLPSLTQETPVNDASQILDQAESTPASRTKVIDQQASDNKSENNSQISDTKDTDNNPESESKGKVLQGYIRVVPTGTKISIIMDTAVDSDTSQEGDEFSARTAEDLTIDGTTAVPAGSIIRGRIATLNAPKHLNRSGSVALKFDSVTTPDNRQIPLVANLVARGGVVHARRGIKDIAIDTGTFALPTAVALGIGAVAGHSSSSVGVGGGALIGAGVGAVVGLAILMAKKGKRVDVRPGDELKIELAEDLHMPTM